MRAVWEASWQYKNRQNKCWPSSFWYLWGQVPEELCEKGPTVGSSCFPGMSHYLPIEVQHF